MIIQGILMQIVAALLTMAAVHSVPEGWHTVAFFLGLALATSLAGIVHPLIEEESGKC